MQRPLIWAGTAALVLPAVWVAATSPLLAWRDPVYIAAGLAGVLALAVMLFQPLLMSGLLPRGARVHRGLGLALVVLIVTHVAGLWLTSPLDVVDSLLLRSPTPFALWGVIAMWAAFAAAGLALARRRVPLRAFRAGHTALVSVVVSCTVAHALLIEGTMGTITKLALSLGVITCTVWVVARRRTWARLRR